MEWTLMRGACSSGVVRCERKGMFYRFRAVCETLPDGVWRAYLNDGTHELLLGVMEPKNGHFIARKRYSQTELDVRGIELSECNGTLRCSGETECRLPYWIPCHDPTRIFRDPAMQSALRQAQGVLVDDAAAPTRAAFPLNAGCACAPALCLARRIDYQGMAYAVLGIDRLGNPCKFVEQTEESSV